MSAPTQDERMPRAIRPMTRAEQIYQQIIQKQREIRLLEIELSRVDPQEPAKEEHDENKKLREALLRIKETKVFLGAIAQEMMDAALRREEV